MVAIVSDNGSDMRMATQQPEMFGIRLYCLTHGLNVTLQNGLQLWKKKEKKQGAIKNATR